MDRVYESGAAGSAPAAPGTPSSGYPTAGNPGTGTPATKPGAYWYLQMTEELRNAIVAAGLIPDHEDLTQLALAIRRLGAAGEYMLVRDEKASGSHGGTFTSGAWRTRTLNTVVSNNIAGASLVSNQITLPAGSYRISASVPGHYCGLHQCRVQNITDGVTVEVGTNENTQHPAATGDADQTRSIVTAVVTLADTKVLEIQHRCDAGQATNGFGIAMGWGDEVYTQVEIWRTG